MTVRLISLIPLALILACSVGCSDKEDADGAADSSEEDGDGQGEGDGEEEEEEEEEAYDGTADPDGDGLTNDEEAELGTDPDNADSDSDGIDDMAEVDAGSDPSNPYSWPGEGVWPDMSADAPLGTGYDYGDTMGNLTGDDQYGQEVQLHQFYGEVILVDFSAGWCGPCHAVAQDAEEMWQERRDDGFIVVHAMIDDWNGTGSAGLGFREEWAGEFGLTFPVLGEGDIYDHLSGLYGTGLFENSIPFMMVVDREMVIDSAYTGSGTETSIASRVDTLLEE